METSTKNAETNAQHEIDPLNKRFMVISNKWFTDRAVRYLESLPYGSKVSGEELERHVGLQRKNIYNWTTGRWKVPGSKARWAVVGKKLQDRLNAWYPVGKMSRDRMQKMLDSEQEFRAMMSARDRGMWAPLPRGLETLRMAAPVDKPVDEPVEYISETAPATTENVSTIDQLLDDTLEVLSRWGDLKSEIERLQQLERTLRSLYTGGRDHA